MGIASQARGETLSSATASVPSQSVSVADLLHNADDDAPQLAPSQEHAPRIAELSTLSTTSVRHQALSETLSETITAPATPATSEPDTNQRAESSRDGDFLSRVQAAAAPQPFASVHQLSVEAPSTSAITTADVAQADTPTEDDLDDDVITDDVDDVLEEDLDDETLEDDRDDETDAEQTDEEDEADAEPTETQVLVAEVAVTNPAGVMIEPDLENIVYDAIATRPGQTTTRSQIQQDINSVFATGFFANVRAQPTDTPLGVRVTFVVEPNPVLTEVQVEGSEVLPETVVDDIFSPQYGEIINLLDFQDGILALNNWYQENGYVLAQVIAAPTIQEDGVVVLEVAEGEIEDINVQFITNEGLAEDDEGNPIRGKTRDFIILREFETEPGDIFQQAQIQQDLRSAFELGIFEDVTVSLNPGDKDPRKVDVTVNVIERNTGSVAAGVGFNFTGDLFGTLSYRQDNFGGNNQKFSAEAQLSTRDILFDISFTDPWIGGDPYRTSYTLNGFARRSISLVFDGGDNEIDLSNGDRVRINRYGSGVTFRRPLDNGWSASAGTLYQRVRTTDSDGNTFTEDAAGNPLTASGDGADDLWTVQFGVLRDQRNDAFTPTSGSVLRFGTEQSIPLGAGSIFFNRLRGSYSQYFPVSFLNFNEGPQAIAINVQGGTILGDFPPYEAFSIGGTNSVRGYDEGDLGTGQSYLQASVEYRFPLFSFLGGAIFLDAGTDLGTGDNVPGSPGPDRGKPGSGFGYGAGVRVQTPLGPIRVDYGFNDQGDGRLHFGIGERF